MSIYCYINNSMTVLSSTDLENIYDLEEFKSYITKELKLNNVYLICYHNFSTLNLINILKTNDKINKNYVVTTKNDINVINFLNLNTLYNTMYEIPKLMTIYEFKKNFTDNNIQIFNNNQQINVNDTFIQGNKYYYKFIS
jgi:hypothetical protein